MQYEYWLASLYQLPDEKKRRARLISGTARELYNMSENALKELHIFSSEELFAITESRKTQDISYVWNDFLKKGIAFVPYFSEDYPEKLTHIYDPPYALYVKGRLPDPDKKSVAIVGARACSEYGRSISKMLGKSLAEHGVRVISGMALGVDSASHAGALSAGGDTFAVLGGGCDICYPRSSYNIYENILDGHGGVISENIPGTQPLRQFFPQRNRIISGLSDILIVVEARERSGSLITADCALDQGKDIYAVPGRYGDDLSKGTNRLIEQGAGILYDLNCFLKNTGIVSETRKKEHKSAQFTLEKEESLVYSILSLSPKYINLIVEETGLDLLTSLHTLGSLVKKGLAQETFQNYFCKKI